MWLACDSLRASVHGPIPHDVELIAEGFEQSERAEFFQIGADLAERGGRV
jgi:hypothetical protein